MSSAEESDQEGKSDAAFSIDLGSSAPTRDGDLTMGDTATSVTLEAGTEEGTTVTPSAVGAAAQEEDEVAVALPPTESEESGEYHEIVLTGSAALDLLDQVGGVS